MAEIKIEKKKSIWPWILGILLLAAIIYIVVVMMDEDNELVETDETETVVDNEGTRNELSDNLDAENATGNVTGIAAYMDYIQNNKAMGLEHEYSHNALLKLIEATDEIATDLEVDIRADLDEARANANTITKDPEKLNHADKIKNAGMIITRALRTIQQQKYSDLKSDIDGLEKEVNQINPQEKTLDQKNDVKSFFDKAADVLTKMDKNYED